MGISVGGRNFCHAMERIASLVLLRVKRAMLIRMLGYLELEEGGRRPEVMASSSYCGR